MKRVFRFPLKITTISYKGIKVTIRGVKIGIKYLIIAIIIRWITSNSDLNIADTTRNILNQTKQTITRLVPNTKSEVVIETDKENMTAVKQIKEDLKKLLRVDVKIKASETKPFSVQLPNPIDVTSKNIKKVVKNFNDQSDQSDQEEEKDKKIDEKIVKDLKQESNIIEENLEESISLREIIDEYDQYDEYEDEDVQDDQ